MDLTANAPLALLLALLVSNYLVMASPYARRYAAVFYGLNAVNVAAGVAVMLFGLPGIERFPFLRLLVSLVVLMHVAQNFQRRTQWALEEREDRLAVELDERKRLQAEPPAPSADDQPA